MSLTIPVVRSWSLDTIAAQVALLREDDRVFDTASTAVRNGAERQLDGLEGDTVTASVRSCGEISRDLGILSNKAESLVTALDCFQNEAAVHRTKLLGLVESAGLKGFAVNDDGSVTPPTVTGDADDPAVAAERSRIRDEGKALHEDITAELRALERIDLDAGNALRLMVMEESFHSYPDADHSDNYDKGSTILGGAASSQADLLGGWAKDFSTAGKGFTRGIPLLGQALGFGIGIAGAPDDEPLAETLAAEGSGAFVGAATGAVIGSLVPGVGTVAGVVIGGLAGGAASYLTSREVRDHFDDQRAQGKDPFVW